uniref:Uncharacterized protein n=1 Tax=Arundo donax TaxID=35708 RepID=A0A0A9HH00_ARUDO
MGIPKTGALNCMAIHQDGKKGKFKQGGVRNGKHNQANHTEPEWKLLVVDVQTLEEY